MQLKMEGETYGTSVEVVLSTENNGLVFGDTFDLVTPLPSNLDAGFDGLGTRVHGEDHVKAKVLGDKLCKTGKYIIVEGTGTEGDTRGLVDESGDQLRVAVTLIDGGVGREEIKIVPTFGIPNGSSLGTSEDHRQRVVVVGGEFMFSLDGLLSGGSMVGRGTIRSAVGSHDEWGSRRK